MVTSNLQVKLAAQRQRLLRLLGRVGPFLRGSLSSTFIRCGKSSCHCYGGERHRVFMLALRFRGKPTTFYVSQGKLREVRLWVDRYKRLKRLSQEVSDLSLQLLRAQAQTQRLRQTR